jgi:phytoene dehydrogenase-like protein
MIIGTSRPNPFYELYREVGLVPGAGFKRIDMLHCIETADREQVRLYQNPNDLERSLLQAAPGDRDRVRRFIDMLGDFSRFRPNLEIDAQIFDLKQGLRSLLAFGPVARHFIRYWKVPLRQWLDGFSSERLRRAFLKVYTVEDFPALAVFTSMGWLTGGQVAKPAEGSMGIVRSIQETYRLAGGDLRCGSRVDEILVEGNRAVGVRLADGSEHRAAAVISAADGHRTLFTLLGGRFVDGEVRGYYRDLPVFRPIVTIQFGARFDMKEPSDSIMFPLEKPLALPGGEMTDLNLHISTHDTGAAPAGHCVVRLGYETDYETWAGLSSDRGRYEQEKERIADEILDKLEQRYPGFGRAVEVRDVATPMTVVRYTGNWKGAYEGWRPTTRTFGLRMKKTLPGLCRFYMAGQWVEPGGGVPAVVYSARNALRLLCRDLGRRFVPST